MHDMGGHEAKRDNRRASEARAPLSRRDDAALVERLLAGDEDAFRDLFDRYHSALVRLARSFVGQPSTAQEVAQETWLGVLKGIRAFEGCSSLKSWLFRILINQAKTRATREKRTVPFSEISNAEHDDDFAVDPTRFNAGGMWADPPLPWQAETPESLMARKETRQLIAQALAALPANLRVVVTLRDVEGFDATEVCNILEISETNQRVLLHRGRSKLRRALEGQLERNETR